MSDKYTIHNEVGLHFVTLLLSTGLSGWKL
jgi:hypothetical protein